MSFKTSLLCSHRCETQVINIEKVKAELVTVVITAQVLKMCEC